MLQDVRLRPLESVSQHVHVFADLFLRYLELLFLVEDHPHPQVFHGLGAFDSTYVGQVLSGEDLRLLLVQPEVPLDLQFFELTYDQLQLALGLGHDQHVIRKCQEIAPGSHFL